MQRCDDYAGEASNSNNSNKPSTPRSILRRAAPGSSSSVEGAERKRVSFDEESLRGEKPHNANNIYSTSGPVGRLSKRSGVLRRTKGGMNVRGSSVGPLLASSVQALDLSVAVGHSPPPVAPHDGKITGKARRTGAGSWNWSHARPPAAGGEPTSSATTLQTLTRSGTAGVSAVPGISSSRGRRMFQVQEAKNRAARMAATATATAGTSGGASAAERAAAAAATGLVEGRGSGCWEAGETLRERSRSSTASSSGSPFGSPFVAWAGPPSGSSAGSPSGSSTCTSPSSGSPSASQSGSPPGSPSGSPASTTSPSSGSPSASQSGSPPGSPSGSPASTTSPSSESPSGFPTSTTSPLSSGSPIRTTAAPPLLQQQPRAMPRLKCIPSSSPPSSSLPPARRQSRSPVDGNTSAGDVITDGADNDKGDSGPCSPPVPAASEHHSRTPANSSGATAATTMAGVGNPTTAVAPPPKSGSPTGTNAKKRMSASSQDRNDGSGAVAMSALVLSPPPLPTAVGEDMDEQGEQRDTGGSEKADDGPRDSNSPCVVDDTAKCEKKEQVGRLRCLHDVAGVVVPTPGGISSSADDGNSTAGDAEPCEASAKSLTRESDEQKSVGAGGGVLEPSTVAKLGDTASGSTPSRSKQQAPTIVTPPSEASPASSVPSCTSPDQSSKTRERGPGSGSSNAIDGGDVTNKSTGGSGGGGPTTRRRRSEGVAHGIEQVCTIAWDSPLPPSTTTTTSAQCRRRPAAPTSLAMAVVSSSSALPVVVGDPLTLAAEPSSQPTLSGTAGSAVAVSAEDAVAELGGVRDGELQRVRCSLRVLASDDDGDAKGAVGEAPATAEDSEGTGSGADDNAECDVGDALGGEESRLGRPCEKGAIGEEEGKKVATLLPGASSEQQTTACVVEDEADDGACRGGAEPQKPRQPLRRVRLPKRSLSPTVPHTSSPTRKPTPRATRSQRKAAQTRALTSTTTAPRDRAPGSSGKVCDDGGVRTRRRRNITEGVVPQGGDDDTDKTPQGRAVVVTMAENEQPGEEPKREGTRAEKNHGGIRAVPDAADDEYHEEPSWEDLPLMEVLRRKKEILAGALGGGGGRRARRSVRSSRRLRGADSDSGRGTLAVESGSTRKQRARQREKMAEERAVAAVVVVPPQGIVSDAVPTEIAPPTVEQVQAEGGGKRRRGRQQQQQQQQQAVKRKDQSEEVSAQQHDQSDHDDEAVASPEEPSAHRPTKKPKTFHDSNEKTAENPGGRGALDSKTGSLPSPDNKHDDVCTSEPPAKRQRVRTTLTAAAFRSRRTTAEPPAAAAVVAGNSGFGTNDSASKPADPSDNNVDGRANRRVDKQEDSSGTRKVCREKVVCRSNSNLEQESGCGGRKEEESPQGETCDATAVPPAVSVVKGQEVGPVEAGLTSRSVDTPSTVGNDEEKNAMGATTGAGTGAGNGAGLLHNDSLSSACAVGQNDVIRGWMKLAYTHVPHSPTGPDSLSKGEKQGAASAQSSEPAVSMRPTAASAAATSGDNGGDCCTAGTVRRTADPVVVSDNVEVGEQEEKTPAPATAAGAGTSHNSEFIVAAAAAEQSDAVGAVASGNAVCPRKRPREEEAVTAADQGSAVVRGWLTPVWTMLTGAR